MTDNQPELTPEQREFFEQVFHVSLSISETYKNILAASVIADDFTAVKPFIEYILVQCDQQVEAARKPPTGLVDLNGESL